MVWVCLERPCPQNCVVCATGWHQKMKSHFLLNVLSVPSSLIVIKETPYPDPNSSSSQQGFLLLSLLDTSMPEVGILSVFILSFSFPFLPPWVMQPFHLDHNDSLLRAFTLTSNIPCADMSLPEPSLLLNCDTLWPRSLQNHLGCVGGCGVGCWGARPSQESYSFNTLLLLLTEAFLSIYFLSKNKCLGRPVMRFLMFFGHACAWEVCNTTLNHLGSIPLTLVPRAKPRY